MAVAFFEVLYLAACAFLIYVLHRFWRELKRPGAVVRPTSPPGRPRLCVVRTERPAAIFSGARPGKTPKASRRRFPTAIAAFLVIALYPCGAKAQEKLAPARLATENTTLLQQQVADLRALVERLEVRIQELEGHIQKMQNVPNSSKAEEKPEVVASLSLSSDPAQPSSAPASAGMNPEESRVSGFFQGTTINMTLDGYYGYNFNRPVGRVNLLRAYDVSSNSFSLNQPAIILERAPDVSQGRRFGVRLDLQYGQATETLQGSAANEPRPRVYRLLSVSAKTQQRERDTSAPAAPSTTASDQEASSRPSWQYGAFVDLGYSLDFNHPSNHLFRNRSTAFRVDEVDLNMVGVYIRKDVSKRSRWGAELATQAGKDSRFFGFSATAPNAPGSNWLRHFGRANVSYLTPVGNGLTVQAGLFNSFIGYDSLYAKDNFSYTRPWGADYTPYLMFGVNASYPFNDKLTGTIFVLNGYWHLANANSVPSSGAQLAYKATDHWTLKETILFGPHQSDTSREFWRFFSDNVAEWKQDPVTVAFEYQVGTEKVAAPGNPHALWMAAQLAAHWALDKHWSVTVRPEFAWDRDGRWTGFPQLVKAVTSTVEYRLPYRRTNTILRLEYRYDDSRGKGAGFFRGGEVAPGAVGLTPTQHLLVFGAMLTFDAQVRH